MRPMGFGLSRRLGINMATLRRGWEMNVLRSNI